MSYRRYTAALIWILIAFTVALCPSPGVAQTPAPVNFIQGNYSVPQTPQTTVTVAYTAAQTVGNLNVVVVGWNDSTAAVTSVTDSNGNVYARAVGPTVRNNQATQSIYFAPNISAAAANSNIVTVSFSVAASFADIRILEYSGLDPVSPLVGGVGSSGNSTTTNSGQLITTVPNVLLVAANVVARTTTGPGVGFTSRMITSPDGDIVEDRVVTTSGTYSATAPQSPSGYWVMQMVAFKAAIIGSDTTPPAVAITSHTNNQTVTTSSITVSGTASDSGLGNNGISSVTVNGVAASGGTATGSGTANWSRSVTLNPGANTITVVAKDASTAQNSTTTQITVNFSAPDTTGPAVAITSHTNNQTVTTSSITVSGTASDSGLGNNGISSVTVNGVAASGGTATGSATANWSRSITLSPGANTITVVAKDASTAQNSTTVQITVNFSAPDTTGPAVAITSHTNNQTVTTSSITVSGTASDSGLGNNGISSVTVNGVAASGGTATGSATANWSQSITLSPGANIITVVAKDASTAQNSTTVQITVNFSAPDTTGPAVAITSHTNNQTVTTSSITVSGTASDSGLGNNGISSVTVNGVAASGGTVTGSGTANWSQSVTLNPGANTITVVGKDNSTNQNSTTVSITVTYSVTQTPGLVAAYGFNETSGTTVTDVSGSSNNGTFGSGVTRTTAGKFGGALVFNGTSGLVTIPNSTSLQLTTGITLEAWVNPSTVDGAWRDAIYKGNDNYYLEGTSTNGGRPAAGGTFNSTPVYGTAALAANTWTHLAMTYDRATLRLYVNGAQVSSLAATGAIGVSTNPLQIGGDSLFGQFFQGMIDEVRVYNAALTAAQIQADMNTPVGGTPPPDTTGPSVVINSPSNNATVTSSPITVSGTASDSGLGNNGISSVTVNGMAASGGTATGSGTANWSQSITLNPGANAITVVAKDNSTNQNSTTTSITVNYNSSAPDTTGPNVVINSPSNNATVTTSPITVSGTASDSGLGNNGISSVTVNGVAATGGTATGSATANWSQSIALNPGANTITVVAKDNSTNQNSTTASITVTYNATPTGLVAAYAFNETSGTTTADASGNGNTGTLTNGAVFAAGKNGNAISLNGSNQYVNIGVAASLQITGSMTISGWINASSFPVDDAAVVSKRSSTEVGFQFDTTVDTGPRAIGFKLTNSSGGLMARYGATTLQLNQWYHIAGVYNTATQTIDVYLNGQLNNGTLVGSVTSSQLTSTLAVNIGKRPGNTGFEFRGKIDDLRIYNRVLSQAEIQSDMITAVGGAPPPDTTPPTVAINAPAAGAEVFGLVSVSALVSDNVAVGGVQFFVDGQPLGAEAISSPFSVTWDTTHSLGNHVLTAIARDLSNNMTTSAPVSVTVVSPTTDHVGQWAASFNWPIVAVHAHLLRTGEVMASDGQSFVGQNVRVWNPTTNTFTSANINTGTNPFCAGHCALPDGRILVAGGHVGSAHVGVTDTNIFNPTTRQWSRVASMHTPRWYPTNTVLPDGRILVTAGEINCDGCNALIPEIYNPITNTWTELLGAPLDLTYYPHMFVLPDGRVLVASTAESPTVTQALDITTQTWSVIDPNAVDGGSAAMYLPGKVIKSGTSTNPDDPAVPSAETTYVLDMTEPSPKWRETPPMVFPRTYHTLTILPDGRVLATGGGPTTDALGVNDAVKAAELWSPDTETWKTMASMQRPRLYHSTALLLPDARVLVVGGGRFDNQSAPTDQLSGEIYSPPYLFKGTRPLITSVPTQIGYGGTVTIETPDASRIAKVALIKLGSVTHAFNMDQRYVPLAFTAGSGSLSVQTPASGNLAPPGYYMLFIVDANGIPSVAATVNIQ